MKFEIIKPIFEKRKRSPHFHIGVSISSVFLYNLIEKLIVQKRIFIHETE